MDNFGGQQQQQQQGDHAPDMMAWYSEIPLVTRIYLSGAFTTATLSLRGAACCFSVIGEIGRASCRERV